MIGHFKIRPGDRPMIFKGLDLHGINPVSPGLITVLGAGPTRIRAVAEFRNEASAGNVRLI